MQHVINKAVKKIQQRRTQQPNRTNQIQKDIGKLEHELDCFVQVIAEDSVSVRIGEEAIQREERIAVHDKLQRSDARQRTARTISTQ